MKYPEEWKAKRVRLLYGREVYYRDVFEDCDRLAGHVDSRHVSGAKSPGGMVTDTVWVGRTQSGETQEFPSLTLAMEFVLKRAGCLS